MSGAVYADSDGRRIVTDYYAELLFYLSCGANHAIGHACAGRASPDCKNDLLKVFGEDFALIFASPIGP
jgi:hypothetical protein